MCLTGPLGCGKSILLERATNHWIQSRSERREKGVTISLRPQFMGRDLRAFNSPDLVLQLLQNELVTLSNDFIWVGGQPEPSINPSARPDTGFITDLLTNISQHINVMISLDLEHSQEWVARRALSFFLNMQSTKARFSLIVAALQMPKGLPEIRTSDKFRSDWNNTLEIEEYVLKHSRNRGRAAKARSEAAYSKILSKAGSNYLWAHLVIERFQWCQSEKEVNESVDELPERLISKYNESLRAVQKAWLPFLIWLALAPCPLSVELAEAVVSMKNRNCLIEDAGYTDWDNDPPWKLCGFCVDVYAEGVKMWALTHSSVRQYIVKRMMAGYYPLNVGRLRLFRSFRACLFKEHVLETDRVLMVVLKHLTTHIRVYMAHGAIWEPEENSVAAKYMARNCAVLGVENPLIDLLESPEKPLKAALEPEEAAVDETVMIPTPTKGINANLKALGDEGDEPILHQATESPESYPTTGIG
jgi:hypothetical protein